MKTKIDRFYTGLPETQKVLVADFKRTRAAQKSIEVDGVAWRYYDSERGNESLLLLHGGFVDHTMWMHQIVEFEKSYRILAPTCPVLPEATMAHYSRALGRILNSEGISKINVLGYSEGGTIAQCFLRDHRDGVQRVVLGHTFYPFVESRYYKYDFSFFRTMPAGVTELLFRQFAKPDREGLEHDSTEWIEWYKGWFKEVKSKLTKPLILTHIDLMSDFVRNYRFEPEDLSDWDGSILITVSADDAVLQYDEGMKRLYPGAEHHRFPRGLGAHSLALITPRVFNRRIAEFLRTETKA